MMWMASLLVELLSSQSLWILSMPNTEAPHEELSLVVKKWKQEGTFIAHVSVRRPPLRLSPSTVIVLDVLLTTLTMLEFS